MKRLRYLVVALLLVSLVALTGCLPSATKIRGDWESTEALGGHVLKINFGQDVGGKIPFVGFAYSFKTTINWGTEQFIIDANADAEEGDAEYSLWVGTSAENVLGVWKYTIDDSTSETYVDFEMSASLDGGKLYIDYLMINDTELINNGDFGPDYLVKK